MSPIDIEDILERARNSARVGDHETAERLLKNYIVKVPDSREARLLLGTTFAKEGKFPEAEDEFINLLARDPSDTEALNNAAVICRRQGKLPEALNYLKDAIEIDSTKAEFHYNIGNIHKQMGNSKEASMAYARVIELDPGFVPAYNNLGTIYEQLQEYDKAYVVFRKGLTLDSNNPTLHFNFGVALEATGRLEEAANEYRAALRSKPGWPDPMNNLGIVLFKQGRHDKAMSTFNRVLSMDPFNAEAHNNIGVVLADQGKNQEAVKNYRRAIESNPRYTRAVINLERALEASGDFSDAVIELEKLVKLSPDDAEIRNRLGGLYLKMERYPEAMEQAEAALQWEPESTQALRVQGAVQRIMGNDTEAQACFEKILSLDPGNYTFLMDLADIHFRRKEYKEAEERIQSYLIRRPNDRAAKLLLGKLYAEMGNRTHAIQVFEELAKVDPNDTEALAAAAELLKETGALEKALRTADTLVNVQGKRGTADDLLDLNKSLEFYESAVDAYSTSVQEMWDRNVKLMGGEEEKSSAEEDVALLMGAAGVSHAIDEGTETLFAEGRETFPVEEDDRDLVLGEEYFGDEVPEETQRPRHQDPLDSLADPNMERPPMPPPRADNAPPPSWPEGTGAPPPPQMPPPNYPPYPTYPPYPSYPPPFGPGPFGPPPAPDPAAGAGPPQAADQSSPPETPAEEEQELDMSVGDEFLPEEEIPAEQEEGNAPAPEDFLIDDEPLDLSPDEFEEPVIGEETPEDISEKPEAFEEPGTFEEPDAFPEPETFGEPDVAEEVSDDEPLVPMEEDIPDIFAEPESDEEPAMRIPPEAVPLAGETIPSVESNRPSGVSSVIGLLNCLKQLTEVLPEKERNTFLHGNYSTALESVIDSLKKLTIIGDTDGSGS